MQTRLLLCAPQDYTAALLWNFIKDTVTDFEIQLVILCKYSLRYYVVLWQGEFVISIPLSALVWKWHYSITQIQMAVWYMLVRWVCYWSTSDLLQLSQHTHFTFAKEWAKIGFKTAILPANSKCSIKTKWKSKKLNKLNIDKFNYTYPVVLCLTEILLELHYYYNLKCVEVELPHVLIPGFG